MSVYRCKMCGGTLEVDSNSKVVTCDYCGTTQTIYSFDNEKKENLFKRANLLRYNNDFDEASIVYQNIVSEFPNEAEAYWGLLLCKFGIEYVDDSRTGKKIPVCHRTQYLPIFSDSNYKNTIKHSDAITSKIYEKEAKEIDRLQKAILDISFREQPYDIFICYKETDSHNNRTEDSVIGQKLYECLTDKGYKVFFSKITLANKLGYEYEPYIFAALQSSKVMILISTQSEFLLSPWVKNEWSRFLKLVNEGKKEKRLVLAYKNLSTNEMPQELTVFQGQDLSKIGGFEDLVLGIQSLSKPSSAPKTRDGGNYSNVSNRSYPSADTLSKRAFIFVDEKNWAKAREYFDKCLDIEPENPLLYLGLVLCDLKKTSIDDLNQAESPLDCNANFETALKFSTGELKEKLERLQNDNYYFLGVNIYEKTRKTENMNIAISYFSKVKDFKESSKYILKCKQVIKENHQSPIYSKALGLYSDKKILTSQIEALKLFESILDYKNSSELAENCRNLIIKLKKRETTKKIVRIVLIFVLVTIAIIWLANNNK